MTLAAHCWALVPLSMFLPFPILVLQYICRIPFLHRGSQRLYNSLKATQQKETECRTWTLDYCTVLFSLSCLEVKLKFALTGWRYRHTSAFDQKPVWYVVNFPSSYTWSVTFSCVILVTSITSLCLSFLLYKPGLNISHIQRWQEG